MSAYNSNNMPACVSAADRDRAVGREALQLCSSQRGAVALVSVRGSRRAPLGAGKQLFSLLSQTTPSKSRQAGLPPRGG